MTKRKLLINKIILSTLLISLMIAFNVIAVLFFINVFLEFILNFSLLIVIISVLSKKLKEIEVEGNIVKIYAGSSLSYLEVNGERIEELKTFFEFAQKACWEKKFSDNNVLKIEIKPINSITIKLNDKIIK